LFRWEKLSVGDKDNIRHDFPILLNKIWNSIAKMAITLGQAVQTLLAGKTLSWQKFRDQKAGVIHLAEAGQRRLFAFLLSQPASRVFL